MSFPSGCRLLVLLTIFTLVFATIAFAQRDMGTITGTITDPQGGVVPNAKITITEVATGLKYEVTSGSDGLYIRPALKPGTYTVAAEAKGFRRVEQQNVVVIGGDRVGANLVLPVGDVTQSVEVSTEAALLETESTTLGGNVTAQGMSDLPLGGQRTFSFLARLSPGVLVNEQGARDATGGGFSANGVRSNGQNNFLLNGVDNNVNVIDFLNQTSFVVGPSVEAIGEMQVLTNGYNAEYGRGAGGVVSVSIKSGTNQLHGTLFEILQNKDLNANRWENIQAGVSKGPFRQNQFGAAIGGPIIKNRTFIFGDYQGTRIASSGGTIQNLGYGGPYTIPSAAERAGNFQGILGSALSGSGGILQGTIYDPASTSIAGGVYSRTPFPNNTIPTTRFDPAAAKIAALYPATNQPVHTGGFPANDYFVSTPGTQTTDQGDLRVDHRLSDKDSLFGTMSWADTPKANGPPFPGALDGAPFQGASEVDLNRNAMISWTRVWTPHLITETRIGFSRLVTSRTQANSGTDEFKAFGIAGYDPTTTLNGGLPQIQFCTNSFQTQYCGSNYSQIGANSWLPSKEYSNVWDFIENVSVNKGTHALKFGAEYRPIQFPFFQVPYPHGEMYFGPQETAYPTPNFGGNGQTGDAMASFLLGNIDWGEASTNNFVSSIKSAYAFYAQDDWKVTPKLTVSLGLRYELFSPIGEKFARQSNFDMQTMTLYIPSGPNQNSPLPPGFATTFPDVHVSIGAVNKYLIPWDKKDFGPRVGFAYSWRPKTVFRGSYGIFYGGEEQQGGNPNRGESVPFNESVVLQRPPSGAGSNTFDTNPFFSGGVSAGFPTNIFAQQAPVQFRALALDFRNSIVYKWNVAVQHELGKQWAVELAYVGNHQAHSLLQPDQNAAGNLATTNSAITYNGLRPHPDLGQLFGTASNGLGNYAGMTVKIDKHFSDGLMVSAAYTYGHALANSGTTLGGSVGFGNWDNTNLKESYSSAPWDIRHNFVANFVYDIPFGKGKKLGNSLNPVANALIANWQINGILTLHTGNPFTLDSGGCVGIWAGCYPDLVPGKNPQSAPSGGRSPAQWFDTSAVMAIGSSAVTNKLQEGTLGLQSNWAPPLRTLDFSVFKDFVLTEKFKFQFRAEATNLFDTNQYNYPDNNASDGNFGKITSTLAGTERHIQMSLRFMF
ncbi:MAG TPA: carboxypeptidase regulatory-like domain-containing protein [Bryobacteraceae bacterium]|nr:carboxypeptidase regulatory-like domain-containing protein [Bryobacteraceae bacterium]